MTPKELEKLVNSLRSHGVSYLKTPNLEVHLTGNQPQAQKEVKEKPLTPTNSRVDLPPSDAKVSDFADAPKTSEGPENIPHKVQELTSIMKLSDRDLLDRLFPEPTKDEQE